MIELIHNSHTLVLGCGNPLFGDDGFGPAVIQHLEAFYKPPKGCAFLDVGTSIREFLFDIVLSEQRPEKIIILDAVDMPDRVPGEVFEIDVDQIRLEKISDFSLHQFPTTNMLKELKDHTTIDIRLMVVQLESLPDVVAPGLSVPVENAVHVMAGMIAGIVKGKKVKENVGEFGNNIAVEFSF